MKMMMAAVLAGFVAAVVVFILWNDSRALTSVLTWIGVTLSFWGIEKVGQRGR